MGQNASKKYAGPNPNIDSVLSLVSAWEIKKDFVYVKSQTSAGFCVIRLDKCLNVINTTPYNWMKHSDTRFNVPVCGRKYPMFFAEPNNNVNITDHTFRALVVLPMLVGKIEVFIDDYEYKYVMIKMHIHHDIKRFMWKIFGDRVYDGMANSYVLPNVGFAVPRQELDVDDSYNKIQTHDTLFIGDYARHYHRIYSTECDMGTASRIVRCILYAIATRVTAICNARDRGVIRTEKISDVDIVCQN